MMRGESKKEVIRIFDHLCDSHSRWSVWADFINITAIAISNSVDKRSAERREQAYMSTVKKYNKREADMLANMFGAVVIGMEENQEQDYLGALYMALELGDKHNGQLFTPYNLCACTAQLTCESLKEEIKAKGWISVSDPACGAGALLVAIANECIRQQINYRDHVLFAAQDIDYTAAMMCYIQLSLLGCAGYVVVDNTLTNPSTSYDRRGLIPISGDNVWYTPCYFKDAWHYRRMWAQMDMALETMAAGVKEGADDAAGTITIVSPQPRD